MLSFGFRFIRFKGGDYLASYFENDDDTYEHADSGGGEDEEDF